ncbi:hypothetical protein [Bradyrhizobium sp. 2]|uniref:hypothetical protein n=1 Tax=Bradyrhizobium sp. 2 TaxID=190045 RepID=UPI001FFB4B3D|nr:hypothetical protein [Bradyrhizobium sp. 2]
MDGEQAVAGFAGDQIVQRLGACTGRWDLIAVAVAKSIEAGLFIFLTALVRLKFTGKISHARRANPVPRRFTGRGAYGRVNAGRR